VHEAERARARTRARASICVYEHMCVCVYVSIELNSLLVGCVWGDRDRVVVVGWLCGVGGTGGLAFRGALEGQVLGCGSGVVQLCAVVGTFEFSCFSMIENVFVCERESVGVLKCVCMCT